MVDFVRCGGWLVCISRFTVVRSGGPAGFGLLLVFLNGCWFSVSFMSKISLVRVHIQVLFMVDTII